MEPMHIGAILGEAGRIWGISLGHPCQASREYGQGIILLAGQSAEIR